MDIQRQAFEESNNVKPDWSFKFDEDLQQYVALDGEMQLQVDEFNEHWDTFRAGWSACLAQKVAVPEGFVLVEKDLIQSIHQSCVNCLDIDFKPVFKAAVSTIRDSVKPLTESQGQIDISKFDDYTPMLSRSKEQVG